LFNPSTALPQPNPIFVAPTFMVDNGIGNAHPAGDEPPRYKTALEFLIIFPSNHTLGGTGILPVLFMYFIVIKYTISGHSQYGKFLL